MDGRPPLRRLVARAPEIILADQGLDWPPIISFRGPAELWLER